MNEIDIKVEVLAWIRRASRGRSLPIVTSEFSLNGTGIRADLALLGDGFCGIEIKSSSDTLKRLPSQMEGYARYFDETMLVVAAKHEKGLANIDLKRAGVWVLDAPNRHRLIRPGTRARVVGHTLIGLLTAIEERRAVQAAAARATSSDNDTHDYFRMSFEAAFRRRYEQTSNQFWQAVKGRSIRADDLKLLSRFYPARVQAEKAEIQSTAKWSSWIGEMNALHASL